MRDVILHAFNWRYTDIIDNLEAIHKVGYGAILIPPPLYSDPNGDQWWQRYQPKDYRVLLSALGGKPELEQLIAACHALTPKIQVYADIIINHMANEDRPDHLEFPGAAELERYKAEPQFFEANRLYGDLSEGLFSERDFNRAGDIEAHEWSDRNAVQFKNLSGLPDLKHNEWVLQQQRHMVGALIQMGFDGFRVDAVKHTTEYMMDNLADYEVFRDKFWFGEVLVGSDYDQSIFLDAFLTETWISAYDFPLFRDIQDAFRLGGSLKRLIVPNSLPWNRAVTFVINHDIPHNEGFRHWLLEPQDEHLAYAYLLGRDGGMPLIYSDNNESNYLEDKGRWLDAYKRPDISAMIGFHNAVHGESMDILYITDLLMIFRRGSKGIVAINKSNTDQWAEFNTWGLKNPGTYQEMIHGHKMTVSGDKFTLHVPPRSAQMWVAQ